jgi:hypothetical protein
VIDEFGYFTSVPVVPTYTVTPTAAQSEIVSTSSAPTTGAVQYTATGLGTTAVNVELFSCSTTSTGPLTFTPNTSGDATQGTVNAGVEVINGISDTTSSLPYGPSLVADVTPVGGSVTFTVNSGTPECDVPVVYTYNSAVTTQVLPVNSSGVATVGVGNGGAVTWSAAAAGPGTYSDYTVSTLGPAANTFQACSSSGASCYTFTYDVAGSTYNYDETPGTDASTSALPLSEGEFAADVNVGDELSISYGGTTGASIFNYVGEAQAKAFATGNVPGSPTKVTAAVGSTGVTLNWTAPSNPDVFAYEIDAYVASAGVYPTSPTDTYSVVGTQTADGVVSVPPATTYTDTTNYGSGAEVEYTVQAFADGNNGNGDSTSGCAFASTLDCSTDTIAGVGDAGGISAPTTPITFPTVPSAAATGPMSTSTSLDLNGNTDLGGTSTAPETIDVFFNTPVTVASDWSMEVASTSGDDIGLLDSSNATASVASGGLQVIITITGPAVVVAGSAPSDTGTWEILSQGGFAGTGTGTPAWNLVASGAPGLSSGVTRAILGAGGTINNNTGLAEEPAVELFASTSTVTPNSITATCTSDTENFNIYSGAGALVTSIECSSGSGNYPMPSGVTLDAADTYEVTSSAEAAPVYGGAESQTAILLPGTSSAETVTLTPTTASIAAGGTIDYGASLSLDSAPVVNTRVTFAGSCTPDATSVAFASATETTATTGTSPAPGSTPSDTATFANSSTTATGSCVITATAQNGVVSAPITVTVAVAAS